MLGVETIALEAAKNLAGIFVKNAWETGGKILGQLGETVDKKVQNLIFTASKQYVQNYSDRHGILKVLGMREPVALESVYTAVQFLDKWDIRRFESIENLEISYRETRSFQPKNCLKRDGLKVANEKQYLMVLGGPGAGKSTFLRKLGLEVLKGFQGGFEHECIPVFIELKGFRSENMDVQKSIVEEFRLCDFPNPEESTTKLLEQGKLLILLDGLDEVPAKVMNETIGQIQNFVDLYKNNRFIISCRTAAYRQNFRRFTDVAMAEFDNAQIKQFIGNWFHSELDKKLGTAQKCWQLLQKRENAAAKELAQTPLLLTLLCLVYDRSQNFPANRSILYRKALRVLLEEWAAEKRILQDEIYQGMRTELEEILLAEIAHIGFEADRLFFSQQEVVSQIKAFLASNLNAPKHLDGEGVLKAIAVQQGILVERAEDVFSFSHLTLQEYLTAQYITDHYQIPKLVAEHLNDKRWQEVFLLVTGLMRGGADELLLMMEKEAQKHINTPKLQGLLNWSNQVTEGTEGNFKPAAKRTTALFLALGRDRAHELASILSPNLGRILEITRVLDLARAVNPNLERTLNSTRTPCRPATHTRAFSRALTRALAQELQDIKIFKDVNFTVLIARLEVLKAKAPGIDRSDNVHQGFNNRVSQTWLNALKIKPELICLCCQELQALEDYLYANLLIVKCKQAAVRMSPKIWEAIEARMLLGNCQD
ncbi:NACHT domain-containing protein [Planktothrix sp. FACHB-1355]|uniref:NACHT domain-containing protein n=1 Tax=Aerosakkonema funiforme FACHB-1375 TaxID=2949571 RepID=A0A926VEB6_9CYAN|nr:MULTISPECIES: NACHT domain-containing protein [Oscillatoriales]MBD2182025.1 NACHT domain-containing protein [Aerosakkonema funiforme FACHB-1375]MBD3559661.1 NACHT domain-containing protein [Planktothrix sp. FACHB-1355]